MNVFCSIGFINEVSETRRRFTGCKLSKSKNLQAVDAHKLNIVHAPHPEKNVVLRKLEGQTGENQKAKARLSEELRGLN